MNRVEIKEGTKVLHDLPADAPFELAGVHYPPDWFRRGGALPGKFTVRSYTRPPPPSPPPPPTAATGAQVLYEVEAGGGLDALLAALSEAQKAKLYARRRIVAGDDVSEILRTTLALDAPAMAALILAASERRER